MMSALEGARVILVASTKQNSHNKTRLYGVRDGNVPGEGEAPSCTPRRKFMSSQILEAGQGWSQETLSSEVALEAEVYGARSRQADRTATQLLTPGLNRTQSLPRTDRIPVLLALPMKFSAKQVYLPSSDRLMFLIIKVPSEVTVTLQQGHKRSSQPRIDTLVATGRGLASKKPPQRWHTEPTWYCSPKSQCPCSKVL